MKTMLVSGRILKVFDSIEEMPIVNFQKYNKFLIIDSGIGSDMNDVDAHITRIAKLVQTGDTRKTLQELQNLRQNLYMVNSEISPKYMAFAALIHSIDGERVIDLSDDNLKRIIQSLNRVKHSAIIDFLWWLKKKLNSELETYFPEDFSNVREKDAYDRLRARTLLVLDSVANGTDNSDGIEAIDKALLQAYRPNSFSGASSVEVTYDKQFESACLLIAQRANLDARGMTVLQFYSAFNNIRAQIEAEAKSLKRTK